MGKDKPKEKAYTFSLNEIISPRFRAGQIRVDSSRKIENYGVPKSARKLTVGRKGKVEYSK